VVCVAISGCTGPAPPSYETNRFGSASRDSLAVNRILDSKYSTVRALEYDQKLPAKKKMLQYLTYGVYGVRYALRPKVKEQGLNDDPQRPIQKKTQETHPEICNHVELQYLPTTLDKHADNRFSSRPQQSVHDHHSRSAGEEIRNPAMVVAEIMNEPTPF
jgi:hypothetical protein